MRRSKQNEEERDGTRKSETHLERLGTKLSSLLKLKVAEGTAGSMKERERNDKERDKKIINTTKIIIKTNKTGPERGIARQNKTKNNKRQRTRRIEKERDKTTTHMI